MEAYEPRAFRFIELLALDDWRMKLYGIAWRRELPRAQLFEAAKRIAVELLRNAGPNNYKVGFIGAHDGRKACLVFVDYWGNEDELFHRVFLSRSNDPDALAPAKDSDLSVCIWDLHVQSFERAAWIKYILRKATAPDFHGYLGERLNEKT
jgi:hypothetical protein